MHSTILKSFVIKSSQEDYVVQMCVSCTLRLRLKKIHTVEPTNAQTCITLGLQEISLNSKCGS